MPFLFFRRKNFWILDFWILSVCDLFLFKRANRAGGICENSLLEVVIMSNTISGEKLEIEW